MAYEEVGRWTCSKCGRDIVAAGQRTLAYKGIGSLSAPCPWDCGAWINRGFRSIRSDAVRYFRAHEWDERARAGEGPAGQRQAR